MKLVIGSISLSLAVFTYCFVLLGARNPKQPKWASEMLVANVHCILIIGLGLAGILTFASALYTFAVDGIDVLPILISAAILAVTFFGVKAMKITKKLAEFENPQTAPGRKNNGRHVGEGPKLAA
jgi:hypothetical protein